MFGAMPGYFRSILSITECPGMPARAHGLSTCGKVDTFQTIKDETTEITSICFHSNPKLWSFHCIWNKILNMERLHIKLREFEHCQWVGNGYKKQQSTHCHICHGKRCLLFIMIQEAIYYHGKRGHIKV